MNQTVKEFREIWLDKKERSEFLGGLACILAAVVLFYIFINIFA